MMFSKRVPIYLFCFVVFCSLIDPTISAPSKVKAASHEEDKNKSNGNSGETGKHLTGSHTIIRPTHIFKTKEESENPKNDFTMNNGPQRDVRPFEWLYKHLNEYLMCVYGGHGNCEQKLAGSITMEEMNMKLDKMKNGPYGMPHPFGPPGPGPMPGGEFGSRGPPMMWMPGGPPPPPPGPYDMGPGKPFQMEKFPAWKPKQDGPMDMNGPRYPFPQGPGPYEFENMQHMQHMQQPPMQSESQYGEPMPVLLSLRAPGQYAGMEGDMRKNGFMGKMINSEEKKKEDKDGEKTESNQRIYGNQYPGMMPLPMYGVPSFVAQ